MSTQCQDKYCFRFLSFLSEVNASLRIIKMNYLISREARVIRLKKVQDDGNETSFFPFWVNGKDLHSFTSFLILKEKAFSSCSGNRGD